MPNIKSQKKRVITNEKANVANTAKRTRVKSAVKAYKQAIEQKNVELAEQLLPQTISIIDSAKSDGLFHPANAARKIARLSKALSDLKAEPVSTEA